jgi:hypothetical protein
VSRVEPKLQVESALPKYYRLNHRPRKSLIHLGPSVHGRRKTELVTVILKSLRRGWWRLQEACQPGEIKRCKQRNVVCVPSFSSIWIRLALREECVLSRTERR